MKTPIQLAAFAAALTAPLHANSLTQGGFKVDLNPAFPGLLGYSLDGNGVVVPAASEPVVLLNGKAATPTVRLLQTSTSTAEYHLDFAAEGVAFKVALRASRQALDLAIEDVRETGAVAVRTIAIPGLVMLAGSGGDELTLGNFPAASYASEKPEDHDLFTTVRALEFKDNADKPEKNRNASGQRGVSYAFVANGKLAAGIFTNVLEENLRAIVTTSGEGDQRTFAAAPGQWTYREIPSETIPAHAKLVVATDLNGDGKATWQDAAIAYRNHTPRPFGAELTRSHPIAHIAMNFGSQATHPFLRVLDNAKKVWLYTDGLGQRIQFKGFAGEGHDSSHPDYAGNVGRRMGGRDDLNFVMRRGRDFNVQSGVHINAHEYHKEAKWFSPEIADLNAVGWSWLDESYLTDYRHDSAYGTLYQRLEAMRADLPWLDFVYLDVYYGRGWPGWRMHTKTNGLGILQFTEFPGVMERAVVWNHVANDWTQQIGGKGDRSEIARFIHYSLKDTFKHEPLLRGSNCDGFMGWHAERSMLQTIRSAFTVNLPTKYLQHSDLIRQEPGRAWFANGSRAESDGTVSRIYGRDGQLVNSCRYEKPNTRPVDNLVFIPWDADGEEKVYHWNDKGGDSSWQLPARWHGAAKAELYRLTDLGRVFEREVAVANGRVELTGIAAGTPYVLYRNTPPDLPEIHWGEGGLVRDPGFDSHRFGAWSLAGPAGSASFENHPEYGQTELVMAGPEASAVRQTLTGLTPGTTYAASAWVSIDGGRETTFAVEPAPAATPPFIDRQTWKAAASIKHLGNSGPLKMLDGSVDTLWHSVEAKDDATRHPHAVTLAFGSELTLEGFVQTMRPNKGNGALKGYRAEVSTDGVAWTAVAEGDFDYQGGITAPVRFASPVKATHFRLTGTSTLNGTPFSSIAELDMITPPPVAKAGEMMATVANTVQQTRLINYTDQSGKYMRNWHRLKVRFTAPPSGRADVVLRAGAGGARVAFDDVRVVPSGESRPPSGAEKVVLFEDFENVDEGWGPFMYGWQGPMNTHFSEANPPYTNDTIQGEFSLKSRFEDAPDLLYRTVPATLKLKPGTTYQVSFDYLCDKAGCFAFFAGPDGVAEVKPAAANVLSDGSWTVRRFTGSFTTDDAPDWFIGITKLERANKGTIVIDNLLITE